MNVTTVARKISERSHRPSPVMTTGEILASIGSAGMREAIERNWLVPDFDTGFMMVNFNGGKLAEVAEACKCPECKKTDCNCESLWSGATSARQSTMPRTMREAWGAPGVGSGSNSDHPAAPPMMPHAPPAPINPATPPDKKPQIGSQVAAAEMQDGKEKLYPGTVSGIGSDGRYRLDFGTGQRPPMDREYGPDQLRFVEPAHV